VATKSELVALGQNVLKDIGFHGHIKPTPVTVKAVKSHTQTESGKTSIYLRIGTLPGTGLFAEVWFDADTGWGDHKFWCGFSCRDQDEIEAIADRAAPKVGKSKAIIDLGASPHKHHPAHPSDFGKPVLEGHVNPPEWCWYGFYTKNIPKPGSKWVREAATFLQTVSELYMEGEGRNAAVSEEEANDQAFKRNSKERKRLRNHTSWERDPKLAQAVKVAGKFECKVCGFRSQDEFGPNGKYAEAHHLNPLGLERKKKTVKTNPKHMVCVCANCHRMFHRFIALKGSPISVTDLQSIRAKAMAKR